MRPTVWIFEDQLSPKLNALTEHPDAHVLLIESKKTFSMFPYHKARLGFLISAMRHFAADLEAAGRDVHHHPLKSRGYRDSIAALRHHIKQTKSTEFIVVRPSEWHTQAWLDTLPDLLGITIRYLPNRLFLVDRERFAKWAKPKKKLIMEFHYRQMRKDYELLMDGDKPAGGDWNFDKQNRKPAKGVDLEFRPPKSFKPDAITKAALADVEKHFGDHPGSLEHFAWPVSAKDAKAAWRDFLKHRLPLFGDYEDALLDDERILFHALTSPLLNAALLDPLEMCADVEKAYRKGDVPINAAEGFIRQIVGWREFVYGIYWTYMPEYRTRNQRDVDAPLPPFFWDGDTDMHCLHRTITDAIDHAYGHHIQRLMVLSNFATLAGLSPQAVNDWFLSMFIDSHDWVMAPNVIGMGMNSDHDTIATKPYVSSANYIDKMSDYCGNCRYSPKKRTGDDACPFNFMYWTFLEDHREKLGKNPRMNMVLKNIDKFGEETMQQMRDQRTRFVKLTSKGKSYEKWNKFPGRAIAEGETNGPFDPAYATF
ncbi:MAG: cryptochrome/photolyase family protein [Planctomycetota bacterium]